MDVSRIEEMLRTRSDGSLIHRESKDLEFKEQYNNAGFEDYLKDFAAFANNCGGYIIFGIKDSPRKRIGLKPEAKKQFESVDPEKITEKIMDVFAVNIDYEVELITEDSLDFGVMYVSESTNKPIIAKKNFGRSSQIHEGAIYYRYGGRSQKIRYSELESIIQKRVEIQIRNLSNLMNKIIKIGPENAAILDTEAGQIQKNDRQILMIDKSLVSKLKFIREGQFKEKEGAETLKLVGEVIPIGSKEIVRYLHENLIEKYPLTYTQLWSIIKKKIPGAKQGKLNELIRDNNLKYNEDYSAFNFRSKSQQDHFNATGDLPIGTPSIYNQNAVEYLLMLMNEED